MNFKSYLSVVFLVFLLTTSLTSHAAIQHVVDGNGQLTGATGVLVNGSIYDVDFVDDTFINAFNDTIPLIHNTLSDAVAFGNSLNNSVFLDIVSGQFDTKPNQVSGCGNSIVCFVRIPYELEQGIGNIFTVNTVNVNNYSAELSDAVTFTSSFPTDDNFSAYSNNVYAVFTPSQVTSVPEPASYIMFLFGLLFLYTAFHHTKIDS